MNKSKTILASVGGVALLASLVLAYLIWSALSEKGEKAEELESAIAAADRLTRLPVYPGPEGVQAYKDNAATFDAWREEALKIVAAGDMAFEATTPPAFKAFLVDSARRLSALPGAVDGRIVKEDFPFGFKDYITGGVLPRQDDLSRLQREWHDVSTVVEALAKSGVLEIVDVSMAPAAPAVEEEPAKKRGGAKRKKQAGEEKSAEGPAVTRFKVEFRARPSSLVDALNEFSTISRFVVVDDFSFVREKDDIAEALGGEGRQQQAEAPSRGRRRRGRQAAEEEARQPEPEKASGIVADPMAASPLKVAMSFSVYDFRSLEGADGTAVEKSEEEK